MTFENNYYYGSLYKEDGEWVVYICDLQAQTFKKDWFYYFEHKKQALSYFKQYKSYQ
jgi:hypothetical protein